MLSKKGMIGLNRMSLSVIFMVLSSLCLMASIFLSLQLTKDTADRIETLEETTLEDISLEGYDYVEYCHAYGSSDIHKSYCWSINYDVDHYLIVGFEEPPVVNLKKFEAITEKQWSAICFVESTFDHLAYNKSSGAAGIAQIKKICVDDINRLLKDDVFTYEDRYDPTSSRHMFNIYTGFYTDGTFEERTRVWHAGPTGRNGRHADRYWKKIKELL